MERAPGLYELLSGFCKPDGTQFGCLQTTMYVSIFLSNLLVENAPF